MKIGKPISVDHIKVGDRAVYRQLIDEVMFEIQALCGQEYVNTYAGAKAAPAVPTPSPAVEPKAEEVESSIPRRSSAAVLTPRPLVSTR